MKLNSSSTPAFAAYIGLDWADANHAICLQAADSKHIEASVLQHRPETIDAWARALRQRFNGQPIAVALELFKGPIVSAVSKYDCFVLFPINPATLVKYRQTWTGSGAKDDPSDAALALDLLLKHPDRFQPLQPQSAAMRALEQLVEQRRRLVDDQTRITNRLTSTLKNYFPQPLAWFPDFGEQRERYAMPDDLQQYAGIAPVTERSGRACWVHWRWQCPTFLRQTFVEWAALTIPRSFWARAYYDQQRQKGNSHQAAVRSLAFKWIRILFRCWRNRTPYDESAYLTSLKKRGSPLIQHLASSS